MSDEQLAIAPTELETPAIEPQQEPKEVPQEIVDEPVVDAGDDDSGGEPTAEELEEFDWNGKKVKGPKGLKDGVLMQADYTRKTQAIAEQAKALEAQAAQQAQATDAELDLRANLRGVNAEIERFKEFDWNAYQMARQTDPFGADEAWNYAQHLRTQKAELEGNLGQFASQRTAQAQQDLAKRVQETKAWAEKEIPGWKPEVTEAIVKFAEAKSIPEDWLQRNWSPVLYELLHCARIGDQALKRQAAAPRTPTPQTAPIAPLQTVTAKASPATRLSLQQLADSGRMEEYAAARKAGRTR